MVVRVERIGQNALAGSGANTVVSPRIRGKILAIKFQTEASITVKMYTTSSVITEYIFGTSGAAVTVATDGAYYPRVAGNLASTAAALGASNQTNAFVPMVVDGTVTAVVTGTDTKTYTIEIYYEV